MKKVMVHIESEEDYEAINELRSIVNEKYSDSIKYPKLFRDNRLVNRMKLLQETDPGKYRKICDDSLEVRDLATQLKVTYRHLRRKSHRLGWLLLSAIFLLFSLPVFLAGAALNILIFQVAYLQAVKIEGSGFHKHGKVWFLPGTELYLRPTIPGSCHHIH